MGYKILKNKTFHIPTERIKEAEEGAKEEEKIRCRIDAMTDEEYEEYIRKELAKIDTYTEEDYMSEEEFWTTFNEKCSLLDREEKNYEKWRKILEVYRTTRVMNV